MKNYNDTITKPKYDTFARVYLEKIVDHQKHETFQGFEEERFNWDLTSWIYEQGFYGLYDHDDMFNTAMEYLLKKHVDQKYIDANIDQIKGDIVRSCAYAYESDYMGKLFDYIASHAGDIFDDVVKELPKIDYEVLFYSREDNTLHNEFKYNTSEVRLYVKRTLSLDKFFMREFSWYEANENDFSDALQEYVSQFGLSFSLEHFDYYGTVADYDQWYEIYKENEETSYEYKKELEKKVKHTKAVIKIMCRYWHDKNKDGIK